MESRLWWHRLSATHSPVPCSASSQTIVDILIYTHWLRIQQMFLCQKKKCILGRLGQMILVSPNGAAPCVLTSCLIKTRNVTHLQFVELLLCKGWVFSHVLKQGRSSLRNLASKCKQLWKIPANEVCRINHGGRGVSDSFRTQNSFLLSSTLQRCAAKRARFARQHLAQKEKLAKQRTYEYNQSTGCSW